VPAPVTTPGAVTLAAAAASSSWAANTPNVPMANGSFQALFLALP
jgi:hypothetical protein